LAAPVGATGASQRSQAPSFFSVARDLGIETCRTSMRLSLLPSRRRHASASFHENRSDTGAVILAVYRKQNIFVNGTGYRIGK
jgi:hypothetical protein